MAAITNGENSRLLDSVSVLHQVRDYAIQNNISTIACLGDFFHTRKKIDVDIYNTAYSIIEDIHSKGLTFILIAGNHDIYYRNNATVTSLRPMQKYAKIVNEPYVVDNIVMLPYYEQPEKFTEVIQSISVPNPIYFLHAEYKGAYRAKVSKDIAKHGIDSSIFPADTQRVFMGHYHMQQALTDKIMYLGSPLQITTREIYEDKFFYVFDTVTLELIPIKTTCSRFAVVEYPSGKILKYCNSTATIEEAITNNYVEVVALEPIKKTTALYKLLSKAKNYIVTAKIKVEGTKTTNTEVDMDSLDLESLNLQYTKDHPHENLTEDFLNNVRAKITTV